MNILIVDSNEVVRRQLFWTLRREHEIREAAGREEARGILAQVTPDAVLMEVQEAEDTSPEPALAFLQEVQGLPRPPLVLVITRSTDKLLAARLLELGVVDVLAKPVNPEELPFVLGRMARLRELRDVLMEHQAEQARKAPEPRPRGKSRAITGTDDTMQALGIIGVDPRIKQILEQIRRIAPTPVSVLITGETGTGKEVIANAVHRLSERAERRFVPVNCAVLTDTLVEDELFGHEKGAFTGAVDRRMGKFEVANHGTLFLDEIAELSLALQSKFLRVLQERTYERLGGNQPITTDFRLVCATHQDLPRMTQDGRFREDLMFRINVISFLIPPLRERREDIRLLAQHFLKKYATAFGREEQLSFSREVVRYLNEYHWPGNVRELEHFVERSVALSSGKVIGPEALPDEFQPGLPAATLSDGKGKYDALVKQYKKQLLVEALELTGNNKLQTAALLGISKSHLFKLLRQLAV